jgi:hypothetical protein
MRLAAQVQARTQQRAAEDWLDLFVLVSTHGWNLAARKRAIQARLAVRITIFTEH